VNKNQAEQKLSILIILIINPLTKSNNLSIPIVAIK